MDVLTRWRRSIPHLARPPALAALVAATLVGCGARHVAQGEALPPAVPVPPPATTSAAAPAPTPTVAPTARTTASPADRTGAPLSAADAASFARLQRRLGGRIGLAVSGIGAGQPVQVVGSLRSAIAWSTSKVPLAMAIYAAGLAPGLRQSLTAAITASDNAAAERLWAALGGGTRAARAVEAQLRLAGDRRTVVQSRRIRPGFTPFGQTLWRLADQTRFTAGMVCLGAGRQVLGLMDRIVAGERWGLGATGLPAQFKGGWGPGTRPGVGGGYLDRQLGIVTIGGTPAALSIASLPRDGSHATGTRNLTAIARWAVSHVSVAGLPRTRRCAG